MNRGLALIVTGFVVLGLNGLTTIASAASTNLYLLANGEPTATMSLQAPGGGSPGIITLPPSAAGAAESNPAKYQQWSYDMSQTTASVNTVTIWAMPFGPTGERPVAFAVHLMDCAQSCVVLKSNSKTIQGGGQSWSPINLPVKTGPTEFGAGHSLVVKLTVLESSAADMMFAYGTPDFPSALHLSALSVTSTTTTAAPPTSPPSPPTTPPTTAPSPPTTAPSPPTTPPTAPPSPPTTSAKPPTTTTSISAVTTTSIASTTTTTTPELLVVGNPPADPPPASSRPVDLGESMPEMVSLTGSVDTPVDQVASQITDNTPGLRPAQGLGVVFSSVSETFTLYWEVAVGLGLLMSVLLMIGFDRIELPRAIPDTSERIRRIR